MAELAAFHRAFAEAIVEQRPQALARFLDDPSKASDAIVYCNNVFRSALDALAATYQSVERLAGHAFFERAAAAFVEAAPPRQRTLVGYGAAFPEFLEQIPEMARAPYLPDAARLDRAWLAAHLAADAPMLTTIALSDLAENELAELRPGLHPSVQIAALNWDVHDAWAANRDADGGERTPRQVLPRRSWAILWRFEDEVRHSSLSEAEARFFMTLPAGASLGEAAESALSLSADFETHLVFAAALKAGLLAAPGRQNGRGGRT